MTKIAPLPIKAIDQWIAIGLSDKKTHFWMIPPRASETALSSSPAILRLESTTQEIAAKIAAGVCSAFHLLNPDVDTSPLWHDRYWRGDAQALAFIAVSKTRAKGWGPVKLMNFIDESIMAAFPDAISFLYQNPIPRALSCADFDLLVLGLVERAAALDEARAISLASPNAAPADRKSRL